MPNDKIFDSAVRSAGDRAGVFEYDGETGYFYLYDTEQREGRKVISAIRVLTSEPDFVERDLAIRWDSTESKVGLVIRGRVWAVFDLQTGAKYGGNYGSSNSSAIPPAIIDAIHLK